MKGTDHFKRTVQMYLEQRADEEALLRRITDYTYSHIQKFEELT